jgi:hypothetical protein
MLFDPLSTAPVVWPALLVSDRHDDDLSRVSAVADAERETGQNKPPSSVLSRWESVGASAICEMAFATSWAKATALTGLRSSYQFRASPSSARAAGWNLTVIPAAEELFTNFFPRNRLDGAGIELRYAASDLA